MTPRLLFELPVLRPATAQSFDIRPAALAAWLAQLPMANLGEACRQVFLALYEVNRTQQPVSLRLRFLERLAGPLALVSPALQRHYIGQPFPLSETAQRIARLAVDLQVELVIGYRLVRESARHQPWYQPWGRAQRKALAAQRMLHYLGGILSDYQWQHLPYPRGVWRAVHHIFRHEGRVGRMRRPVPGLAGADAVTSVLDEYKRLLLRALVPPSHLSVGQWQYLDEHLDGWLALVELDPTSVEYGFWLRLDSDSPPTELPLDFTAAMGGNGKYTVLNTRRLVQHMERLLAGEAALPAGLDRDGVETLRNAWSGARGRHAERHRGRGQKMQLLAGFNTLYHALAGIMPPIPEPGAVERPPTGAHATAMETPPVAARVVDRSDSGYGLELTAAAELPLKEGDAIGLRRGPAQAWDIGEVCWLHAEAGKPLTLGVQRLAVEALPVELIVHMGVGHSAPLGCLLGTMAGGEIALFMPKLPGVEHKSLRLGYRGHDMPITLLERLDASSGFYAYRFDSPPQDEHPGLAAQDAWLRQREVTAAAARAVERYRDVWQEL